jgi:FlaA1/EpsC-like NDP-sugar epimerase
MVKRHNRLLVGFHVVSDALLAALAFVLAYALRFRAGVLSVPKGHPPFEQYLNVLPLVAGVVILAYYLQGLYRLRRARSLVDDFFAVFVGSIVAVVFGMWATLYFQAYYLRDELKQVGVLEISQLVWALFLAINVLFTFGSRELVRQFLERRWRAGIGLKRVLIAGAGELGRLLADRILEHRDLGLQIVGFLDDRAGGDHLGYRGLPLVGTLAEAGEIGSGSISSMSRCPSTSTTRSCRSSKARPGRAWTSRSCPTCCSSSPFGPGWKSWTAFRSSASTTSRSRA